MFAVRGVATPMTVRTIRDIPAVGFGKGETDPGSAGPVAYFIGSTSSFLIAVPVSGGALGSLTADSVIRVQATRRPAEHTGFRHIWRIMNIVLVFCRHRLIPVLMESNNRVIRQVSGRCRQVHTTNILSSLIMLDQFKFLRRY